MKMRAFTLRLAAALLSGALAACALAPPPETGPVIAIVGGAVVDPAVDGPAAKQDILIDGDRIVAVGRKVRIPRGARRVDAAGKFLTPGLWDSHAHFNALTDVGFAPEIYVGYGVLHARDMGGDLATLRSLRASILSGERTGPAIFIAGPTLNGQQAAPFHRVVANEAEARAAVGELSAAGVDYIKTHRRTSREALFAMIDEARKRDLEVYGHVPLGVSWIEAANGGMRSTEHIFTILENELTDPANPAKSIDEALARIDGERGDAIFQAMAAANAYLCPTLVAFERTIPNPPELADAKRAGLSHFLSYVGRANHVGVPILAGSDVATDPGESLLREVELLVEAGLTPREALMSATANPAHSLRRADLARIAPGAPASFLILEANPTEDIAALRRIDTVLLRGRIFDRETLSALRAMTPPRENAE